MSVRIVLKPPSVPIDAELLWVLLRAFGPIEASVPDGNRERRLDIATALQLVTRIASRHQLDLLGSEVGYEATESQTIMLRGQVAQGLAILESERLVCELAKRREIPCVLLKFAALRRYGVANVSTRPSIDLDLLVNDGDVEEWGRALEDAGAVQQKHWVPGYHPAVYCTPNGINVELHVRLPYLHTVAEARSVSLKELRDASLLSPIDPTTPYIFLPRKDFLAAHLIAHGLVQHVYAPTFYPSLRLLADMVDLGLWKEDGLIEGTARWVVDDLPSEEIRGLAQLAKLAATGTIPNVVGSGEPAERVLYHLLASALDRTYQRKLRRKRLAQVLSDVGALETVRHLGRALRRSLVKRVSRV
jgi:hypothetical protein